MEDRDNSLLDRIKNINSFYPFTINSFEFSNELPVLDKKLSPEENLFKELFTRYGNYTEEMSEKTIRIYEQHPEKLHTEKDILHYFDKAQKDIEQLERVILQLKAYENALTERYNFIKTAPTKQKIKLYREKRWKDKVYYFILFYSVNLTDGHEELMQSIKYTGKERRKAIEDFEKLQKERTGVIFEKDIKRAKWER